MPSKPEQKPRGVLHFLPRQAWESPRENVSADSPTTSSNLSPTPNDQRRSLADKLQRISEIDPFYLAEVETLVDRFLKQSE